MQEKNREHIFVREVGVPWNGTKPKNIAITPKRKFHGQKLAFCIVGSLVKF